MGMTGQHKLYHFSLPSHYTNLYQHSHSNWYMYCIAITKHCMFYCYIAGYWPDDHSSEPRIFARYVIVISQAQVGYHCYYARPREKPEVEC